jgi:hypothetical protein
MPSLTDRVRRHDERAHPGQEPPLTQPREVERAPEAGPPAPLAGTTVPRASSKSVLTPNQKAPGPA